MGVLGKVTGDLEAPRGPDVEMKVSVPASWLGREVSVTPPRNLHCAACGGGGCDTCERAGAVSIRGRRDEPESFTVRLPDELPAGSALCLRIPEQGGASPTADQGRGHLLLMVTTGQSATEGIELSATGGLSPQEREQLMKRSLFVAVALILLFLGMLKLSGWL